MKQVSIEGLEKIIMSDEADLIRGKSRILFEKAQNYKEACALVEKLRQDGFLEYEAEDPLRPYTLHCIWIRWNFDKNGTLVIPAPAMAELMSKMDKILLEKEASEWQLSSRLYVMVD